MIDALIGYICLLIVITFHEWAHAWTAWKLGDPTARLEGRVSLNPTVHMDPIGTVALPLFAAALSAVNPAMAGFIIGWGRPVPVDPSRFRNRRLSDTLVSLAGPGMNIVVAIGALILTRILLSVGLPSLAQTADLLAVISLLLCFFNLIPIPPLDGSHVFRHMIRMPEETYLALSRFGLLLIIVALQIPLVRVLLHGATEFAYRLLYGVVWAV